MFRKLIITAATTSAILFALPAAAQDMFSEHVKIADLNLSNSLGAQLLARRINSTIERLCGQPDVRQIAATQTVMKCRQQAWASVRPQMETQLTAAKAAPSYAVARR